MKAKAQPSNTKRSFIRLSLDLNLSGKDDSIGREVTGKAGCAFGLGVMPLFHGAVTDSTQDWWRVLVLELLHRFRAFPQIPVKNDVPPFLPEDFDHAFVRGMAVRKNDSVRGNTLKQVTTK